MALSSCTSPVTEIKHLYPPQAYLVQCNRSEFSGKTYGDVVDYLVIVMRERDVCASQIDSIREWQSQTKAGFK